MRIRFLIFFLNFNNPEDKPLCRKLIVKVSFKKKQQQKKKNIFMELKYFLFILCASWDNLRIANRDNFDKSCLTLFDE
jgi:hypothetical protein